MPKVCWWGIELFNHSMTKEISMVTQSFWTKLISIFCALLVFIQSTTSSGNTDSALSVSFSSLMNCIGCSWVQIKTYRPGVSNTWTLQMSWIISTIDSHQYNILPASSTSLSHLVHWKAAPGRENRSRAWPEHWQWIALEFLTAQRMIAKLWPKQPLMKW